MLGEAHNNTSVNSSIGAASILRCTDDQLLYRLGETPYGGGLVQPGARRQLWDPKKLLRKVRRLGHNSETVTFLLLDFVRIKFVHQFSIIVDDEPGLLLLGILSVLLPDLLPQLLLDPLGDALS